MVNTYYYLTRKEKIPLIPNGPIFEWSICQLLNEIDAVYATIEIYDKPYDIDDVNIHEYSSEGCHTDEYNYRRRQ